MICEDCGKELRVWVGEECSTGTPHIRCFPCWRVYCKSPGFVLEMCKCAASGAQKIFHAVIPVAYPWLGRICGRCKHRFSLADKNDVVQEDGDPGYFHLSCERIGEENMRRAEREIETYFSPVELSLVEARRAAREFSENNH